MNPLRWVRWRVVAVLASVGAVGYFVGLDGLLLATVNSAGRTSPKARWRIEDLAIGLLAGNVELSQLLVHPAPKEAQSEERARVLEAAAVSVDVSTVSLLRRRAVVDLVRLSAPQMLIARRDDGSTNVGDLGEEPEEPEAPEESPPRDWVGTAKRWYERLQKLEKIRKKLPKGRGEEEEKGAGLPWKVDYSRGVTYPFEGRPGIEIREFIGDNLAIQFQDASQEGGAGRSLASLQNGKIAIRNVSNRPSAQDEPMSFELTGDVSGAKLALSGTLDLREGKDLFLLDVDTGKLPVAVIEAFIGPSLPVSLKEGSVRVRTEIHLEGEHRLEVAPSLAFSGVRLEAKDPSGKVAGIETPRFVKAFNEVSEEIGELEIADLRITGSLSAPKFEWGDTVQKLVVEGAKAFAQKKAGEAIERGRAELEQRLEGLPIPKEASGIQDSVKEAIRDGGAKDAKKLLPGSLFGEKKPGDEGR